VYIELNYEKLVLASYSIRKKMRIVVILQNPNRGPGIEMMIKRIDICIIIRNENLLSVKDASMN
jgi:hypothetical protein